MALPKFYEMTSGRQIADIEGVIREVWEHDEAHGQEASRIVDPTSPEDAWIECDPDALVDVRDPHGEPEPLDDDPTEASSA